MRGTKFVCGTVFSCSGEKPKTGEYRYLRFTWKADGCRGIMLQLHDEKDWHIRYTAGVDAHNWGTKFVAEKPHIADVAPTVLTLFGLAPPSHFDGKAWSLAG